jgi:uncharacterized protein (TIGR00297 family)
LSKYDEQVKTSKLAWQSKLVLLLVLPATGAELVLEGSWWATQLPQVAAWTLGLSLLLGLEAWRNRSATAGAAASGASLCAILMLATTTLPYAPWRTALVPLLSVLILTAAATRYGRYRKEQLGTAESRHGRGASQVAANLGVAALVSNGMMQTWLLNQLWLPGLLRSSPLLFVPGLAALAEAAADTVSSELGQVWNSHPRMLTTLRRVEPGTDGAVSLAGTLAGVAAAGAVAIAGAASLRAGWAVLGIAWAGGVAGLFIDSLLGATLERLGWLNNDAVNFLSTASSAAAALGLMAVLLHNPG